MGRVAVCTAVLAAGATAQEPDAVGDLLKDPAVKAALDAAKAGEPETIEDQIRFCEVAAPYLKESARADALKRSFQQLGLQNVRTDKAGNVLGDRPGAAPRPRFVIAARLDTVFPEGTDVKVTRDGSVLHGPGIVDDCRGLAVLVGIIRSLRQANVQTPGRSAFRRVSKRARPTRTWRSASRSRQSRSAREGTAQASTRSRRRSIPQARGSEPSAPCS